MRVLRNRWRPVRGPRRRCRAGAVVLLGAAGLTVGTGCAAASSSPAPPWSTTEPAAASDWSPGDGSGPGLRLPATEADRATVRRLWRSLPVAGPSSAEAFDRGRFGQRWSDDNESGLFDHDGCDTRNDVLARDLRDPEVRPGTQGCVVVAGILDDPYTGRELTFAKADAQAVPIDHVVSLHGSWEHGASAWSDERRLAFANDPLNLLAVDGPVNASKGDAGPGAWLPPSEVRRCGYVARFAAVADRYALTVTSADVEAALRACS